MNRKEEKFTDEELMDPMFKKGMRFGIGCAASFVADWESQINSENRMEDIIKFKFNLISKRQIRKKKRIEALPALVLEVSKKGVRFLALINGNEVDFSIQGIQSEHLKAYRLKQGDRILIHPHYSFEIVQRAGDIKVPELTEAELKRLDKDMKQKRSR